MRVHSIFHQNQISFSIFVRTFLNLRAGLPFAAHIQTYIRHLDYSLFYNNCNNNNQYYIQQLQQQQPVLHTTIATTTTSTTTSPHITLSLQLTSTMHVISSFGCRHSPHRTGFLQTLWPRYSPKDPQRPGSRSFLLVPDQPVHGFRDSIDRVPALLQVRSLTSRNEPPIVRGICTVNLYDSRSHHA